MYDLDQIDILTFILTLSVATINFMYRTKGPGTSHTWQMVSWAHGIAYLHQILILRCVCTSSMITENYLYWRTGSATSHIYKMASWDVQLTVFSKFAMKTCIYTTYLAQTPEIGQGLGHFLSCGVRKQEQT